ncbi:MAG: AAA family ATPase [Mycobacteriales bacterium]
MHRVLVIGQSGSGKSTLARVLARRLLAPYVELDALFHGPGWMPRPTFSSDVDELTRAERWVVDGNYQPVRELLWSRADTVVWLDLPRWLPTARVLGRSIARALDRRVLWNGNRESVVDWWRASHPIRWSWQTAPEARARYEAMTADPRYAGMQVVRLQHPRQVRRWLAGVTPHL